MRPTPFVVAALALAACGRSSGSPQTWAVITAQEESMPGVAVRDLSWAATNPEAGKVQVRCTEGHALPMILTAQPVTGEPNDTRPAEGNVPVRVQWDNAPPRVETWFAGNDGRLLLPPLQQRWLDSLAVHTRLNVMAYRAGGDNVRLAYAWPAEPDGARAPDALRDSLWGPTCHRAGQS